MAVYKKHIIIESSGDRPTFKNITDSVKEAIVESGVKEGICVAVTPHTTCSVFFEEFAHDKNEDGIEFLQIDLNNALRKIIPDHVSATTYNYPGEEHYKAVMSWPNAESYLPGGDKSALWNGDAHLKSSIMGSSQTFEVIDGKLGVGVTGYVYFVDFDCTRPRTRRCSIIVIGE